MVTLTSLDQRIASIEKWINVAGRALLLLYNGDLGVFWRDNVEKERNGQGNSATSTLRAFSAILEFKRFIQEEDFQDSKLQEEVTLAIKGVIEKYLKVDPARPEVRRSSANDINTFTDSHLLFAVSMLPTAEALLKRDKTSLDVDLGSAHKSLVPLRDELIGLISRLHGANLQGSELVHDFITLHAIRALDAFDRIDKTNAWPFESALQERIRKDVLRQLGYHAAHIASRFDPSELTFSLVLLNRFPTPEAPQLTRRAVNAICESQRDGVWPPARPVFYGTTRLLHIVSYEVAYALTQLLLLQLVDENSELPEGLLAALDATFEFAKASFSTVRSVKGWVNDHARSESLIESWTTAIVLMFLLHYRDALVALRQRLVLRKYSVVSAHCRAHSVWPDLVPSLRKPDWMCPPAIDEICDPTDSGALAAALKNEFVVPISRDAFFRPQKAALILYGLPGTRKTSLIRRLAEALEWPMLTISPPDFLRTNGLEGFEGSAAEVFEDLIRLRRVVVLFDECEDFFKKRPRDQEVESRTIGAFITAGMLPRLQALRDKRRVVFVLATNSQLIDLDDAVTRMGRFDWAHEMRHPAPAAQIRYLARYMSGSAVECDVVKAFSEFHAANNNVDISFAQLDAFGKAIVRFKPGQVEDILKKLGEIVREPSPPPLVPS